MDIPHVRLEALGQRRKITKRLGQKPRLKTDLENSGPQVWPLVMAAEAIGPGRPQPVHFLACGPRPSLASPLFIRFRHLCPWF